MPKSTVAAHRARQSRRGFVRVEVTVHRDDAPLVRGVASALSDPARREDARRLLAPQFAGAPKLSLKELLAAAPLEGIDIERDRGFGREVEF